MVCLHFPALLTSPELRPYYSMYVIRLLIQAVIVGAIIIVGVILGNTGRRRQVAEPVTASVPSAVGAS